MEGVRPAHRHEVASRRVGAAGLVEDDGWDVARGAEELLGALDEGLLAVRRGREVLNDVAVALIGDDRVRAGRVPGAYRMARGGHVDAGGEPDGHHRGDAPHTQAVTGPQWRTIRRPARRSRFCGRNWGAGRRNRSSGLFLGALLAGVGGVTGGQVQVDNGSATGAEPDGAVEDVRGCSRSEDPVPGGGPVLLVFSESVEFGGFAGGDVVGDAPQLLRWCVRLVVRDALNRSEGVPSRWASRLR